MRGALLGLVLERPGHGGDLASRVQARLGEAWPMHGNDVYRLLDGLQAEGLVACRAVPRRSGRPGSRVVYQATPLTAEALAYWMGTLAAPEPARRSIEAKLAVAREQDLPVLAAALADYQAECVALSESILASDGRPRSWQALFRDCARDSDRRALQAEIDWADRARRRIEDHARHTR